MTDETNTELAPSESLVADLLPNFDMFVPDHAERSVEVLAYARDKCPVPHTTASGGYYIATRYEDVRQVVGDYKSFSSTEYVNIAGHGGVLLPPIDTDPPLHRDFRALLNPFFHRDYIAERESRVREIAQQTLEPWIGNGQCEFIEDFANPFITDVLSKVVFEEDNPDLFRKAGEINDRVSEGDVDGFLEFKDLMTGFVEERRRQGERDGDIMSAINYGTVDGRPLTDEERVGATQILFSGGLDTTKVAISDIVYELTQRANLESALRTPGWEVNVLEELIRYSSPVSALGRLVKRTVQLGDKTLHEGDRVLVSYQSANRDASAFESPDDLVFDRKRNAHVGFGLGVHRCLGIHLARMQVQVALDELLLHMTNLRLQDGAVLTRRPGISKVLLALPIEYDLRAP